MREIGVLYIHFPIISTIANLLFVIFPPAVLEDFFHLRLEFYEKRKVSSLMLIAKE